ncbi:unnamed protein product [Porites evermanni]|uniref:Uncharacterized protein n=1 Tax=Porites evermanni TaxID=104178 RepID=A0ABN8LQX6_9CNID|nr:unnamed protein product [Porites evermanni]
MLQEVKVGEQFYWPKNQLIHFPSPRQSINKCPAGKRKSAPPHHLTQPATKLEKTKDTSKLHKKASNPQKANQNLKSYNKNIKFSIDKRKSQNKASNPHQQTKKRLKSYNWDSNSQQTKGKHKSQDKTSNPHDQVAQEGFESSKGKSKSQVIQQGIKFSTDKGKSQDKVSNPHQETKQSLKSYNWDSNLQQTKESHKSEDKASNPPQPKEAPRSSFACPWKGYALVAHNQIARKDIFFETLVSGRRTSKPKALKDFEC